ncbi:putative protein kinase [Monocercomonoides exilis]|uniref:putative protein kinase n=1 Tax=Monocercomonoides exilis TaxID=2049356 RepID=UPI00355992EC|nr:putative protein kinase [Monocercomonoides exilis]|eukprot:MONOS_533.1-p1 / transcript=MONOS_533.1 / gene=MONOS_533 / organism=Monocercomonoides_exilis_PA203 / gene_product=serine / transcript_product=serine / location=Mono_scaffold00008:203341-205630(-) / protein_length=536 / sequence_SO=supercontig / SO=protein_coding / is_pseudo=false
MTTVLCINPNCESPKNDSKLTKCASCGTRLLLHKRFLALRLLGKGAFGRTYIAHDAQKVKEKQYPFVVLKMFFSAFTSEKATELFKGEAKQLKMLSHTCIPQYVDDFEQDGRLFLVQEHIEGQTLTTITQKKGCFTEEEVKIFLRNICPVIKYIHSQGVIHRDIKPDNIMLRRRDMNYILVDFGASHWKQEAETMTAAAKGSASSSSPFAAATSSVTTISPLTEDDDEIEGTVIGTPGFIAPEVLNGERNPKCDYYSLGVTALYLLTGVNPTRIRGGVQKWKDAIDVTGTSAELVEMIDNMITLDVEKRQLPTFSSVPNFSNATLIKTAIDIKKPSSASRSAASSSSSDQSQAAPVKGVRWNRKDISLPSIDLSSASTASVTLTASGADLLMLRLFVVLFCIALLFFAPFFSSFFSSSSSTLAPVIRILFVGSAGAAAFLFTRFPTQLKQTLLRLACLDKLISSAKKLRAADGRQNRSSSSARQNAPPPPAPSAGAHSEAPSNPFTQTMAGASTMGKASAAPPQTHIVSGMQKKNA